MSKFTFFMIKCEQTCVCHFFVVILQPKCAHMRTLAVCAQVNNV